VNPNLAKLQPYPFERLRLLFKHITLDPRYAAINPGIGEPKHLTPEFIVLFMVVFVQDRRLRTDGFWSAQNRSSATNGDAIMVAAYGKRNYLIPAGPA
jgi:hypothetical protein